MKKILTASLLLLLLFALTAGANIWGPIGCGDPPPREDPPPRDDPPPREDPPPTIAVRNKVFWVPENLPIRSNEGFIVALYWAFFNRLPDRSGFEDKMNQLRRGVSRQEVVLGFVMSSENKNLRGNTDHNNYFLGTLYNTLLLREPDQEGLRAWMKRMSDGMSRQEVIRRFLDGTEHKSKFNT